MDSLESREEILEQLLRDIETCCLGFKATFMGGLGTWVVVGSGILGSGS
jgi:hypothetical protein